MVKRKYMGLAITVIGFATLILMFVVFFFILSEFNILPNPEDRRIFGLAVPIFIFLFGVLIGLIILWYYYPETRPRRMRKSMTPETMSPLDVVLFVSNDDEVAVINAIHSFNGGAYQFEIAHQAGLHKMKVHRVVERLLARGILKDEYFDEKKNNRKLFLADWVKTNHKLTERGTI